MLVADARGMLVRLVSHARLARLELTHAARSAAETMAAYARARVALRGSERVGRRARCFGRVELDPRGAVRIGDDLAVDGAHAAVRIVAAGGAIVGLGDGVTVEHGTSISARSLVSIGHRVRIGAHCVIRDTDLEPPFPARDRRGARGIMIGDDVWIGARVRVMPGVRIGSRVVIATGSVVDIDVPDDGLVAGRPATVLRVVSRNVATRPPRQQ